MPLSVKLTTKEKAFAKKYARMAVAAKPQQIRFNDSNFHRRGDPSIRDERWYPHYIGKLGEMAYGRAMKKEPSLLITEGGDSMDFPGIEIKTRCSASLDPLLIVKKREFLRKSPKQYVLVVVDPAFDFAHIVGRISRAAFGVLAEPLELRGREVLTVKAKNLEEITFPSGSS